jgi:hypothetical protein
MLRLNPHHGHSHSSGVSSSPLDKCLVSNEVTRDMEKRNKLVNGVADEVASAEGHESVGVDERSQQYQ